MKEKKELLHECVEILKTARVSEWYNKNLEGKPQYDTINELENAVVDIKLTIREALSIALVAGLQWNEKFEGVK